VNTNQELINNFESQLKEGKIQKAYKLIFDFMFGLRNRLKSSYSEYEIPTSMYHGYMDMTYFPIFTKKLKKDKLKIAVVFNYGSFKIEVWLSAVNKNVQKEYWEKLKNMNLNKYIIAAPQKGIDSILEYHIPGDYDFNNIDLLSKKVESSVKMMIEDMEEIIDGL